MFVTNEEFHVIRGLLHLPFASCFDSHTATHLHILFVFYVVLTVMGDPCMFPFEYRGVTYYQCTTHDDVEPWCFVADGDWEYCAAGSPSSKQTFCLGSRSSILAIILLQV